MTRIPVQKMNGQQLTKQAITVGEPYLFSNRGSSMALVVVPVASPSTSISVRSYGDDKGKDFDTLDENLVTANSANQIYIVTNLLPSKFNSPESLVEVVSTVGGSIMAMDRAA